MTTGFKIALAIGAVYVVTKPNPTAVTATGVKKPVSKPTAPNPLAALLNSLLKPQQPQPNKPSSSGGGGLGGGGSASSGQKQAAAPTAKTNLPDGNTVTSGGTLIDNNGRLGPPGTSYTINNDGTLTDPYGNTVTDATGDYNLLYQGNGNYGFIQNDNGLDSTNQQLEANNDISNANIPSSITQEPTSNLPDGVTVNDAGQIFDSNDNQIGATDSSGNVMWIDPTNDPTSGGDGILGDAFSGGSVVGGGDTFNSSSDSAQEDAFA